MKKWYEITFSQEMGREVRATHPIWQGEIVAICELLVLSPHDTKYLDNTDLKYYTFKLNETQDCLVLGEGEIFNHSDQPNVSYDIITINGRQMMQFTAIKNIDVKEQLFIDYNKDVAVDTSKYVGVNLC